MSSPRSWPTRARARAASSSYSMSLKAERVGRAGAEQDAKRVAYEQQLQQTGRRPQGRPGLAKRCNPSTSKALFSRKVNVTDPDSAIVSDRGKHIQGYNLQAAVGEGQVILAAVASHGSPTTTGSWAPMICAARENLKRAVLSPMRQIEQVLADSGYWNVCPRLASSTGDGLDVLVQPRPFRPRPNPQEPRSDSRTLDDPTTEPPPKARSRTDADNRSSNLGVRAHQIPARHHPPTQTRPTPPSKPKST